MMVRLGKKKKIKVFVVYNIYFKKLSDRGVKRIGKGILFKM